MEETEVIELQGKGFSPERESRRQRRINARANLLWMYLKSFEGDGRRHTQNELCEVLGLGADGRHLREAVAEIEHRGWVAVDRNRKPHTYTLNQGEYL